MIFLFEILSALFAIILGASFTSYFSVLTNRGFKKSLVDPSYCDNCNKKLQPWWMIPILSPLAAVIFHGSKSFCCNKKINFGKYFFSELLGGITGFLMFVLWWNGLSELSMLLLLWPVLVFLYMGTEDIWHLEITSALLIVLGGLVVLTGLLFPAWFTEIYGHVFLTLDTLYAALVGAIIVVALIVLSRGKGLGSGDVFIVAIMGICFGGKGLFLSAQLAVWMGTIIGIAYAIVKRKFRGLIVPLVPFLFLGWLLFLTFKEFWLQLLPGFSYI